MDGLGGPVGLFVIIAMVFVSGSAAGFIGTGWLWHYALGAAAYVDRWRVGEVGWALRT